MNSHPRWRQIEDLFHQAVEQPESERQLWLERACAHDTPLLAEVQSLLESDKSTASASIHAQVADAVKATVKSLESEHLPRAVGPYRLLRQIGRGGMGTVYLAERADGEFQKRVAVKMVQPGMDTEFILGRFRRERQVLARFDHPNIGRLLDGGTMSDGIPYFVMEYIDGDWITRYCDAQKLSITKRLRLFLRVCSAVHYAHLHFVVHRDLKPGNILVDSKGQPKLLDFGICKLLYQESGSGIHHTGTLGMHLLTPEYASPEQVRGEPVTIASDLYSLGAVLYELMTGAKPHVFPKLTPQVVEQVVCEQDIIAPSEAARPRSDRLARRLGGDLDNIILHAMCKEPDRRYVTVEHFAEDIRKHLSYQPVMARSDSFGYRSQKFFRRNRLWMGLSLALVLAFSAGLLSTELRTWLVRKAALDPSGAAGIHHPLSRKQQVGLLVELGDSYTQEQNWRGALAVYQQAQAQIVNSAGQVDPQMRAWSDRIRAGIKLAQEQQGRNVGK